MTTRDIRNQLIWGFTVSRLRKSWPLLLFSCSWLLLLPRLGFSEEAKLRSGIPQKTLKLGDYRVQWQNATGAGPSLHIWYGTEQSQPIWRSLPGKTFVQAKYVNLHIRERSGSYRIHERKPSRECLSQTVDSFVLATPDRIQIRGKLSGPNCKVSYTMSFSISSRGQLLVNIAIDSSQLSLINRISLIGRKAPKERYFGLGEQFTHFEFTNRKAHILVEEQGIGRGLQPWTRIANVLAPGVAGTETSTSAPVPFLMTNHNTGLYLHNYEISFFDLETADEIRIETLSHALQLEFLAGQTPLDIVEALTAITGRPPLLPDWVHSGAIIGAMGGSERVRRMHEMLTNRGTAIAAYWLQDWVGQRNTRLATRVWWNWILHAPSYPDWHQLVSSLKQQDIAILGYINPFLVEPRGNYDPPRNLYAEAVENNYLVRSVRQDPHGVRQGGFDGFLIDLWNPNARRWLKDIIKEQLIGNGMDGWMADFGEALPFDAATHAGLSPAKAHNAYPEEWAKVNREAIDESGKEGLIFFSRAMFGRAQKYVSFLWTGDQLTTWDHHDGLKTTVTALLSSGLSGMPINHSDIGGYTNLSLPFLGQIYRSKELLLRWMELNAFTPLFRTHEGNRPSMSHQIDSDDETLDAFAQASRVFRALMPYRRQLLREAHTFGHPLVRPLFLHFADDVKVWDIHDQFMLGPDFLVAPVLDPNVRNRKLYLPLGKWIHLWSGNETISEGEWITVSAPLGHPPVFFRKDSRWGYNLVHELRQTGDIH